MSAALVPALYGRYKAGTRRIVQWLVEIRETKPSSHHDGCTIILTTKDIRRLSEEILQYANLKRPPLAGTYTIISVLEDVIEGRRQCSAWYNKKTIEPQDAAAVSHNTEGHRHFVEVLCHVLDCLRQVCARSNDPSTSNRGGKKKKKTKGFQGNDQPGEYDALHNMYESLTLEDYHDDSPSNSVATSKPLQQQKPRYELETIDGDDDFALWCLLKECFDIRMHIRCVWQQYVDGKTTLKVAADTTDKAFLLIHHMSQTFIEAFTKLATYDQVARYLQVHASMRGADVADFSCKGSESVEDAAVLLCIPAYTNLRRIKEAPDSKETPDHYIERIARSAEVHPVVSMIASYLRDMRAGEEALAYFQLINPETFTRSIKSWFLVSRCDDPNLAFVLQTQIYMDILELTVNLLPARVRAIQETGGFANSRITEFEKHTPLIE